MEYEPFRCALYASWNGRTALLLNRLCFVFASWFRNLRQVYECDIHATNVRYKHFENIYEVGEKYVVRIVSCSVAIFLG